MSDSLKNTFRSFNHTVDRAMALLTPPEYKCLSFASRHILGWSEKAESRRGYISLSMFEDGFTDANGRRYSGTGLSGPTIIRATDSLHAVRLLVKIGKATQKGQLYELSEESAVDWSALETRATAEYQSQLERTAAGRSKRGRKSEQVVNGINHSVVNAINHLNEGEVVNGTNHQWLMGLTEGGQSDLPNQKHFKDTLKDNKDIAADAAPQLPNASAVQSPAIPDEPATGDWLDGAYLDAAGVIWVRADLVEDEPPPSAYPCSAQDINALIGAWWDWVPKRPTKRGKILPSSQHFANKANREYAESLVQRGVTPGDFIEFLGDVRYNPENTRHDIRDEETPFCYVAAAVEDFAAADRADNIYTPDCPRIVHRRPGVNVNLGELAFVSGPELYRRLADHPDLLIEIPPPFISVHELQPEDDTAAEDWSHEWTDAELEAEIPL
jgi:hypothetical protein